MLLPEEDMTMRSFDLSPLFRSTIGFDRLPHMLDMVSRMEETAPSYPPYNIEKLEEDSYRLTMAVAGFDPDELEVRTQDNTLIVSAKADRERDGSAEYLHRGIARRSFERRFELADHMRVAGAHLENGLLHVELIREVPEAMKPRTVEIQTGAPPAGRITHKAGPEEADKAA